MFIVYIGVAPAKKSDFESASVDTCNKAQSDATAAQSCDTSDAQRVENQSDKTSPKQFKPVQTSPNASSTDDDGAHNVMRLAEVTAIENFSSTASTDNSEETSENQSSCS